MTTPVADPLVGKTIGQYEIAARLGGGGMGVVYTARDTKLDRVVALKFLPPQWSHDESAKQRFIREAQAASATDHRNICTIHDIGSTDDGQLFIVMAFYRGQTLKQTLEGGALAVEDAIEIAAQLAEGLAKAHAQGVVHRDIKPGNVIVTDDAVKILDFGLAKFADARLALTLEGSTLGTIAYMSPEQARGHDTDERSDIWAVGVVLYEMLAGRLPFTGGYPEAIAHAIKNDPPPPLRGQRPGVSEALEQLVFRALHKEAGVRFQSARDLARALRLLQGRTLPLDLRAETLDRKGRRWLVAGAAVVLAAGIGLAWILAPVDRATVAIAPVVNQTGYPELDPYRLALTHELTAALDQSRAIRVLPYDRVLQLVRRFRDTGGDPSSRESIEALASGGGADLVLVPTLLQDDVGWRARIELRNARTATGEGPPLETASTPSALPKVAAHELVSSMARLVEERFLERGPWRARAASVIRRLADGPPAAPPRLRNLDTAAAFERGIDAYERQEYADALRAFTDASTRDPTSALLAAWKSRVARIVRKDDDAALVARQALQLVTAATPPETRLFVEAAAAESQRDMNTAEARYRALAAERPGDSWAAMELAGYFDRAGNTADAIVAYLDVLQADPRLARPHVELCRMYNRASEAVKAREHGEKGLAGYRAIAVRAGEGQALLCLADALRTGTPEQRQQAHDHAAAALGIFQDLALAYNVPRAYNYMAMIAGMQMNGPAAAAYGEQALEAARQSANDVIQPLVLMNLGVTHEKLGNRRRAAEYYEDAYRRYDALGDQARAAEIQANRGALLIAFGSRPEDGLRDIQSALAVSRKTGNKDFEAFCLQMVASFDQYAGNHAAAERGLNQVIAIARERNLQDTMALANVRRARSLFALGRYSAGLELLTSALAGKLDPTVVREATIATARMHTRLGEFAAARAALDRAQAHGVDDTSTTPSLHLAHGELAYESGRPDEARREFLRAVAPAAGDLADPVSVEARAYAGLLDTLSGRWAEGRQAVLAGLEQARGRLSLEALSRIVLARMDVGRRQFASALRHLDAIPADGERHAIGPELRAQAHYWRAAALAGLGDAAAESERIAARATLQPILSPLTSEQQRAFLARPDIKRIMD